MPAFMDDAAAAIGAGLGMEPILEMQEYSILKQKVDLDIDFASRSLKGSTEITVQPLVANLKRIRLHCRQCKPTSIQVGGITAKWEYEDPYKRTRMLQTSDVRQHDMLKDRIERSLRPVPQPELTVLLPGKLKIEALQGDSGAVQTPNGGAPDQKRNSEAIVTAEAPVFAANTQQALQFAPIKLLVDFEVDSFRDGIHWIGHADGDKRFPCMYTKVEPWAGNSSCIFPCVDDTTSRCSWDFSIRCARTLGDAYKRPQGLPEQSKANVNGDVQMSNDDVPEDKYLIDIAEEEAAMELAIVCVGELVDDVVDVEDSSRHTMSFSLSQPVTARHTGFAIGPFEHVDISSSRETEQEERLGQSAIKVHGYCLPHRSSDVENTSFPMAMAMDDMGIKYGSFPFNSYQMLFIDDFIHDTVAVAGLSFCSSELLFPKEVIEPMYRNTKILIRSLAHQWMGVNVIAKEPTDEWVVAGIAGFMTDAYLKDLCGNNEFRWQQKIAADMVYDLDVDRPSITQLGQLLHLDRSIRDFVDVKSALVLFILDRRLMKASGSTGVQRIINKIFLNARTGALTNGEVSTADFQRTCERLGHNKLESFFKQWVFNSGCPIFYVTQRFNKKKLVVEMTIVQKQLERVTKPAFEPSNFMREIKEHVGEVWAPEANAVFSGPMTIRIHEADGTPYEHIVEIKEATTRLEIPYNTKYKRLKRSRRQRERHNVNEGNTGEEGGDSLLYCLGDILDTEDDKREWNLVDWTKEDEDKMGQENYEWIRMDADFEWIGKIHLVMPLYMYISQLQQDRDIVAQYDSMRYLLGSNPHHTNLTILLRTLMDSRYFWGIREMAAEGLALCAKDRLVDIGQFHLMTAFRQMFCMPDTNMPKSNDFSDRRNFVIQCAIPRALAKLRDSEGKVPMLVRQFFVDLLKFNDNSNNVTDDGEALYSDNHYVATLMTCLADSLVASHREKQSAYTFSFGDEEAMEDAFDPDADFAPVAIAQIERHRRIDEFESSYQNIYSITALECMQRMLKAGVVRDKQAEVMKYVRSGNATNVRLTAWRSLSEIGALRGMKAFGYLLHCLQEDPSPRFREQLLVVVGEALGHIALGDPEDDRVVAALPAADGLVLEQETSNEARKLAATRKTTPDSALQILKNSLQNDSSFAEALWYAATSPDLTLDEVADLCDIAALVYDSHASLQVRLRLPRMWRCANMGSGKVKFTAFGPYRSAPRKQLTIEDIDMIEANGLRYTGPVTEDVRKRQSEKSEKAALKIRISQTQQRLESAQHAQIPSEMPPPAAIAPSVERPAVKLSLGAKRKQSVDLDGRAGSPKVQKVSKQQSPAGSVGSISKPKNSPARRRSSTPSSKASAGKTKSRIVTLRLGQSAARAQDYLSAPPRGGLTMGPLPQQSSRSITPSISQLSPGFPAPGVMSPSNSMNFFSGSPYSASAIQPMNLGGFRSYDPVPADDMNGLSEIKNEVPLAGTPDLAAVPPAAGDHYVLESPGQVDEESRDSSPDIPLAQPSVVEQKLNVAALPRVKPQQEMAPPPSKPKIKLKLGVKPSS